MRFPALEKGAVPGVLPAWLTGVFISLGTVLGWASIQSMLLKRAGVEFLPYAYIGMGVLGMLGSSVYPMFADTVRRDKLLSGSAVCLAVALLAARMLVTSRPVDQAGSPWRLILFFCITFGVLILTISIITGQLWAISNNILRQNTGRRLSLLSHSPAAVGGILGGISVHLLAATGTPNLEVVWALSLLAVVPLIHLLHKRYGGERRGITRPLPGETTKPGIMGNIEEGIRCIRGSVLFKLLSLLTLFFWVVTGLTDFQFSRIMDSTFPTEEALIRFYGSYAIGLNSAILFIRIALTGRIIRRVGISGCLSMSPLVGLVGFGFLVQSFSFPAGLFMRSSWEVAGRTIRRSSFQAFLSAMPGTLRDRARGFLNGVVIPSSGILSGFMILLMRRAVTPAKAMTGVDLITIAGLLLCTTGFFITRATRRRYNSTLTANLDSHDRQTILDSVELLEQPSSPVVLQKLMELALHKDKQVSLAALATLSRCAKLSALKVISGIMNSEDETMRASAVHAAAAFEDIRRHPLLRSHFKGRMQRMLMEDPSGPVRAEAARFLARYLSREEMFRMVNGMLQHPDPAVRCRVIEQLSDLQEDFADSYLEDMLQDAVPAVRAAAIAALWRVPGKKTETRRALDSLFSVESGKAHAAALKAVIRLGAGEYLPKIEPLLHDPIPCVQALAALACLAVGKAESPARDRAVAQLTAALSDSSRTEEMRRDILPLLPCLKSGNRDALIRGVAVLPPKAREGASGVLRDVHAILSGHLADER